MTTETHKHQWIHWLGITLLSVAAVITLSWFGPTMLDHRGEYAEADAILLEHQVEIKRLRAAIEMCGSENAVAQDMGNGSWQCFNKHGRKTITAKGDK